MRISFMCVGVVLILSGCAILERVGVGSDRADAPISEAETVLPEAAEVEETPLAPTQAEQNAPVSGSLGQTIASLGSPSEQGLWLKTPLVSAERPGRIVYATTGQSANVTLQPIEGAESSGSRISLSAIQAIGASPTDLLEIEVFAEG